MLLKRGKGLNFMIYVRRGVLTIKNIRIFLYSETGGVR